MAKRKQFFLRIFKVYTLLIIIFIILLSGLFFYKNNENIHYQAESQRKIFVEQARADIDLRLNVISGIISQFRGNEDFINYSTSKSNDYYYVVRIREQLPQYLTAFPDYESTIDVYKRGADLVITPRFTLSIDRYMEKKGFSQEHQQKILEFINLSGFPSDYIIVTSDNDQLISNGDRSITIIRKALIEGRNEIVLFVTFYEKYFLPDLNLYSDDTFIVAGEKKIITLKTVLQQEALNKLLEEQVNDIINRKGINLQHDLEIEHNGYYFNVIKSKVLDWEYIYISPMNQIQRKVNNLIINSLTVILVLLTVGIALAFFTAKIMYKPIRNIINSFKSYNEKDDNEEDEFAYLKHTADNIFSANEKLKSVIQNNRISLKDKFLRDLLYGLVPKEKINDSIEQFDMDHLLSNKIVVAVVENINSTELEDNFTKEAVLSIRSQLLLILKNIISQEVYCETIELDFKRYAIILEETNNKQIIKVLSNAMSAIEENFEIGLVAAIGKSIELVEEINKSFHEVLNILEFRHVLDKRAIITMDDIGNNINELYFYPMDFESNLINFVVRGMKNEASSILKRILDENFQYRQLSKEATVELIFAIVATVKRILQKINRHEKEVIKEDTILYLELKMCESKQQLAEKIRDMFDTIITGICSEDEKVNTSIADQMTAYIQAEYYKDISLDDIALHFNLSKGYICSLFKDETGKNFKEYLDIYRVNKAKEFLGGKDIRIGELAEMLGYNSPGTFIRRFKKYVGVSPGQYMENLKHQ